MGKYYTLGGGWLTVGSKKERFRGLEKMFQTAWLISYIGE